MAINMNDFNYDIVNILDKYGYYPKNKAISEAEIKISIDEMPLVKLHSKPTKTDKKEKTSSDFTKADDGKAMISLVDPHYILGTAKVLTLGARKYSKDNWKNCDDIDRYKDALLRHLLAYLAGEENDPETGLSHLYHISCNVMFLDYFDREEK